jgi:hypothetical protein
MSNLKDYFDSSFEDDDTTTTSMLNQTTDDVFNSSLNEAENLQQ